MWSVNDGLSRNLRKPAGNLHDRFILQKTCWKPDGNLPEICRKPDGNLSETCQKPLRRFPEVFGQSVIDGPQGMSKLVSNVCKTFCAHLKQIRNGSKYQVSKIFIFKKCSNSLSLQRASLKRSYYQIISIVKKS